jgi:hypothetical protein
MDRRQFITTFSAGNIGAAAALNAENANPAPASPDAPNILWICTDQQRWDTIGALGNEHIRTPNMDKLCAEGVAFTHAHCQNPICTPSRASFMTGMYPRCRLRLRAGGEVSSDGCPQSHRAATG